MFRPHLSGICLSILAIAVTDLGASEAELVPEAPAAERPAPPSRSETTAAELARLLPSAEVLSLQASDEAFVALWRPANVAEPKGLVILLPGDGESADWPRGIGPLRRGLPDHGWHTLSVSLPDAAGFVPPATPAPERDAPAEQEPPEATTDDTDAQAAPNEAGYLPEETAAIPEEPASETEQAEPGPGPATEPDEQSQLAERIDGRIDAALGHARTLQPDLIVLLGQGTGGYWAARYLQRLAPEDVRHLLLIQPRQPEGQEESLAQMVPALKLATGDFFYQNGNAARAEARARLNASRRIQHPAYHQVGLPALAGERKVEQVQLVRRVRGWLDRPAD